MIPYFAWHTIQLGPLTIQVWGLCVALAIFLAIWVGEREAVRRGLNSDRFLELCLWILVSAFVMARLFHVFAYHPDYYLANPLSILKIWEGGLSSFGGFIGAFLGAFYYLRRRQLSFWQYAEPAAYALPLGYGCGRIGCFLIHDHPGTLSHSFLAVQYPDGSRLDHGLLLSILGLTIFGLFALLRHYYPNQRAPFFLPLFLILYGLSRFILDFYRAWDLVGSDTRYLGLTPAQYGCVVFVLTGALIFKFLRSKTSYQFL